MTPISHMPVKESYQFIKEQGIPTFLALVLLFFLGWAIYVWNNVFAQQVAVQQRQTDLLAQLHEDDQRITENGQQVIRILNALAEQSKANNDARDRQNEILRRMEEKSR